MHLTTDLVKKAMTVAVEAAEEAAPIVTRKVGDVFEFVYVDGGAFVMGSGGSAGWVSVTDGWMGRRLVTEGVWRQFMEGTHLEIKRLKWMRELRIDPSTVSHAQPVRFVSVRNDIPEFLGRVNEDRQVIASGLSFKLPPEAHWERGAIGRGAVDISHMVRMGEVEATETAVRKFVDGRFHHFLVIPPGELPEVGVTIMTVNDALPALLSEARDQRVLAYRICGTRSGRAVPGEAWFGGKSVPADVGDVVRENGLGLEDMAGNLRVWTGDRHDDVAVRGAFAINPVGPAKGQFQVVRNGSFYSDPSRLRVADRGLAELDYRAVDLGLRLFAVPRTV